MLDKCGTLYQHQRTHRATREHLDQQGRQRLPQRLTSEERLAPTYWLRTRGPGTAICLTSRYKPTQLQVRGWYEDDQMRALIPPEVAARFDAMFGPSPAGRRRRSKAGAA